MESARSTNVAPALFGGEPVKRRLEGPAGNQIQLHPTVRRVHGSTTHIALLHFTISYSTCVTYILRPLPAKDHHHHNTKGRVCFRPSPHIRRWVAFGLTNTCKAGATYAPESSTSAHWAIIGVSAMVLFQTRIRISWTKFEIVRMLDLIRHVPSFGPSTIRTPLCGLE